MPTSDTHLEPCLIGQMDLISLLAGAVLGAPAGFWFNSFVQRARLQWDGYGGGSGLIVAWVKNPPRFVGLHLRETVIFGRRLWSDVYFGWHAERSPARDCVAFLYDIENDESFGLSFRDEAASTGLSNVATIASGERRELCLMAFEGTDYFPFRTEGSSPPRPILPPSDRRYRKPKRFRIVVTYGPSGSSKLTERLYMKPGLSGLAYEFRGGGGGSFGG